MPRLSWQVRSLQRRRISKPERMRHGSRWRIPCMDTAIITGAELRAVGLTQAPDGDYFVEAWVLGAALKEKDATRQTLQAGT